MNQLINFEAESSAAQAKLEQRHVSADSSRRAASG